MNGRVNHQPRIAWDTARAIISATDSDPVYTMLSERLSELLGTEYETALRDTRARLLWSKRSDVRQIESGTWRVRLDDALRNRPELAGPLRELTEEVATRLAKPYWPAWLSEPSSPAP